MNGSFGTKIKIKKRKRKKDCTYSVNQTSIKS